MPETHTFVVEHYVPGLDRATATDLTERLERAAAAMRADGVGIQWKRAIALPGEENLICIVEAEGEEQVLRLRDRTGITGGHVQEALSVEPRTNSDSTGQEAGAR